MSAVIPTYRRERVLVDTINHLLALESPPSEILVIDQTENRSVEIATVLVELDAGRKIRWIKLQRPSITHAMNTGLTLARSEVVLFLDDDITPGPELVSAHAAAQSRESCNVVAGQVLQPGEEPLHQLSNEPFRFCSDEPRSIAEIMAGNFSIKRELALRLGGFDENFVQVAYRFESEFARRALAAGETIWFEPKASIRHMKAGSGGTRAFGDHLRTIRPSHAVGEYYYLFRSKGINHRVLKILKRPLRAIRTRHHLTHPWWIPATLVAEALGFFWACSIAARGPRLISGKH